MFGEMKEKKKLDACTPCIGHCTHTPQPPINGISLGLIVIKFDPLFIQQTVYEA